MHGQNREADSIRSVLKAQPDDTNHINSLLALAWLLRTESPAEAIDYSNEAYELSATLDYPKGKATAQSTIGVIEYRRGNLPAALEAHLRALQLREQIGDENGVGKSYINIGNIYTDQGDADRAMEYYTKALEIFEKNDDEERVAMVCLNIGGLYLGQNENEHAKQYCNRTAAIARNIGDVLLEAQALNNSGVCYQNLSQNDSALICYNSSYKLAESAGENTMMIDAGVNIGNLYRYKGEYASAVEWHNEMIAMSEKIGYIDALRDLYEQLSEDYRMMGDYKNAYLSYVKFKNYSDSIYNESSMNQLLEMEARFENEKKEAEIARLENQLEAQESSKQRGIVWVIVGVVGFFLVGGIIATVVVVSQNRKRDRMIIEAQQYQINRMYQREGKRNVE